MFFEPGRGDRQKNQFYMFSLNAENMLYYHKGHFSLVKIAQFKTGSTRTSMITEPRKIIKTRL